MILARKKYAVGDRRRYVVKYHNWLTDARALVTATVTADLASITVDDVSIRSDSEVIFFVSGGALNAAFIVSIEVTATDTAVRHDTVHFTVVSP